MPKYENPVENYAFNRSAAMDSLQYRAQMDLYPRTQTSEAEAMMQRREDLSPLRAYDATPKQREMLMALANLGMSAAPLLGASRTPGVVGGAGRFAATAEELDTAVFDAWRRGLRGRVGQFKSGDYTMGPEKLRQMSPLPYPDKPFRSGKFVSEAEMWERLRYQLGTPRLALPGEWAEAGTQVLAPIKKVPFKPGGGNTPLK